MAYLFLRFLLHDTATTEIYTLSLHDALPICRLSYFLWSSMPDQQLLDRAAAGDLRKPAVLSAQVNRMLADPRVHNLATERSEEHTSELQSQSNLVCRLLLEKKNQMTRTKLYA